MARRSGIFGWIKGASSSRVVADRSPAKVETRASLPYSVAAAQVFAERGGVLSGPLEIPAILRAVTLISGDLSRCELASTDQRFAALLERPNRWQSGLEFRRASLVEAQTNGNSYALIKTQDGEPVELVPWEPSDVTPTWTGDDVVYKHAKAGEYPADRVLHFRALGSCGLLGSSPYRRCRLAVDMIGRAIKVAHEKTAPGSTGKLAFRSPLPDQGGAWAKAFKAAFIEAHIKGSHLRDTDTHEFGDEPVIVSDNVAVDRIGLTLEELTWKDVASYSVDEVYRLSGVPVPYLSGTLAPYDPEKIGRLYKEGCLALWAAQYEAELSFKLGGKFAHDLQDIALPGYGELMAGVRTGRECGVYTLDQALDLLDLPVVGGAEGSSRVVAKNLGTGGGTSNAGIDTSSGVTA